MIFEARIEKARYGNLVALEGISLTAALGQLIGILGANGSGKTTALMAIMGSLPSFYRKVTLDGVDVSNLPVWLLARRGVGFCPDGAWSFETLSVLENLRNVHHLMARATRDSRLMASNPLEDVFRLFPILRERQKQQAGTLSGGERKMLAVGRVLMTSPKVMLLDEPSSGLSPLMVKELYRAIVRIKKAASTSIVLTEQNAEVTLRVANYCLVLGEGRLVTEGTAANLARDDEVRKAYLGL